MKYKKLMTLSLLLLMGCKHSRVTTDYLLDHQAASLESKGRQLLKESVEAMGYDQLLSVESYQADALFDWRFPWGMTPMNALRGSKNKRTSFRFVPNSFDGQMEHLEGRKEGHVFGLQSWQYYEEADGSFEKDNNSRREWALATYHYLIEGPLRLLNADIIRYAGQAKYNGTNYHLVFATWDKIEPHQEHDQWLLYIHPETKMVDLVNATIREYFLPMPKNMAEGTVIYERKKHTSGIYFPTEMTIQLMTPKKKKKHVYQIQMSDYKVNAFDPSDIKPFPGLKEYGDSKPLTHN